MIETKIKKILGDWNLNRGLICGTAALAAVSAASMAKADIIITETGIITQDSILNNGSNLNLVGQPFTLTTTFDPLTVSPIAGCPTTVCNQFGSGSTLFTSGAYSLLFPTGTTTANNLASNYLWGPLTPSGQPTLHIFDSPFAGQTINGVSTSNSFNLSSNVADSLSPIPNPLTVAGSFSSTVAPGSTSALTGDGLSITGGSAITGVINGVAITNNAAAPPTPPPALGAITPVNPQTGANGDIIINGVGTYSATGDLSGGPVKQVVFGQLQGANETGNPFVFNPGLGTLKGTAITTSPTLDAAPNITNNSSGTGPVYVLGLNQNFDLSAFGNQNITTTYPAFIASCPSGCATGNFLTPSYTLQTDQQTVSETGLKNGGAITVTISPAMVPGTGSIAGQWNANGTINTAMDYTPFSTAQYASNLLAGTTGTPADRAIAAANGATFLRTWDAATSQFNLNLRDTEYFFLGYDGGQTLLLQPSQSVPTYYNIILATGNVGLLGWKLVDPIASIGNLPGTTGGYLANIDGVLAGFTNQNLDVAAANIGHTTLSPGAGTPASPILPVATIPGVANNGASFLNSIFAFNASGQTFLDPELSHYMQYAFTDGVKDITLPSIGGPNGEFELELGNLNFFLNSGEFFDLSAYGDPDNFILLFGGPDGLLGRDFVLGLDFVNSNSQIPIFADITTSNTLPSSDVPEPSSLVLLGTALAAGLALRRRSSKLASPGPV